MLEVTCQGKRGESLLLLTTEGQHRMACSRALETVAADMGMFPVIMDVTAFGRFMAGKTPQADLAVKSIKAAIEAADIVIRVGGPNYAYLLGNPDAQAVHDMTLTARQRRFYLMSGNMDKWEITPEEVAAIRRQATWLVERLKTVKRARVTSPGGTDFSFSLGKSAKWLPILGIMPLYGEVAVTPEQGSESGVWVIDGPTQQRVRPVNETGRVPMRVIVKGECLEDISGDPEQVGRLKALIAKANPPHAVIDEVGIVTTRIPDNDSYWSDGTHRHDTLHIGIGNNLRCESLVHGTLHMDGEVRRPTIYLDDQVIVKDTVFMDDLTAKT